MNTFCTYMYLVLIDGYWIHVQCLIIVISFRLDVVAVDFLGHGDSKAPNQPNLYTEEEVSLSNCKPYIHITVTTCTNRRDSILFLLL